MTQQQHNIEQQIHEYLNGLRAKHAEDPFYSPTEYALWCLARAYDYPAIYYDKRWCGGSAAAWFDLVRQVDNYDGLLIALCEYTDYVEEVLK